MQIKKSYLHTLLRCLAKFRSIGKTYFRVWYFHLYIPQVVPSPAALWPATFIRRKEWQYVRTTQRGTGEGELAIPEYNKRIYFTDQLRRIILNVNVYCKLYRYAELEQTYIHTYTCTE